MGTGELAGTEEKGSRAVGGGRTVVEGGYSWKRTLPYAKCVVS